MTQFIDAAYVVAELNAANPGFIDSSYITANMLNSASQELIERTGHDWALYSDHTWTLDGNDETWIYVPVRPIITVTDVKIYNSDRSQYDHVESADISTKFIIDLEQGYIKTIESASWTIAAAKFIKGVQNVEITGNFGADGTTLPMLKHITFLIICRTLQALNPQKFNFATIRERIGKYEYQTSTSGVSAENEKLTLDGIINMLIANLSDNNLFFLGDI